MCWDGVQQQQHTPALFVLRKTCVHGNSSHPFPLTKKPPTPHTKNPPSTGFADNQSDRILLASKGTELFQCYQRTSSRGDVDVTDPAPHAAALRLFAQAQQWQRVVDVDRMRQHQRVVLVESAVPSVVVAYCRLGHVHEATNTLLTVWGWVG